MECVECVHNPFAMNFKPDAPSDLTDCTELTNQINQHIQGLVGDEFLIELQLNCEGIFVGERPEDDSVNNLMLQVRFHW